MNEIVDPPQHRAKESRFVTFSHADDLPMSSISLPFLNESHCTTQRVMPLCPRLMYSQPLQPITNCQNSCSMNQELSPLCPRVRPRGDWNELVEPPTMKRTSCIRLNLEENFDLITDSDSTVILSNVERCGPMRRRNSDQALAA